MTDETNVTSLEDHREKCGPCLQCGEASKSGTSLRVHGEDRLEFLCVDCLGVAFDHLMGAQRFLETQ